MAPGDTSVVEHAGKAIEQSLLAAERFSRSGFGFMLFDDLRGNRSRE